MSVGNLGLHYLYMRWWAGNQRECAVLDLGSQVLVVCLTPFLAVRAIERIIRCAGDIVELVWRGGIVADDYLVGCVASSRK